MLILTLGILIGSAIVLAGAAISGGVARRAGEWVGAGDGAVTAWDIAKWPVLLAVVVLMVALLYWATPNIRQPRFRWISPGAGLAIVTWLVASALFGLYVANLGSYDATYGALGGIVILLVWLWITNVALLIGAHVDVELERERELRAGRKNARRRIQLPEREPAAG
jgi:membrane protein